MSAGRFEQTKYQASYDNARIHPIRLQPESFASGVAGALATNGAPGAAVTEQISAYVSMPNRGLGLKPRTVRMKLAANQTPPAGYAANSVATVPILSVAVWNATTFQKGATVQYLGVNWLVVGRSPEIVR